MFTTNFLKDRVVLVTGAGGCIGSTVARSYANYGATIILLDKQISNLERVYDDVISSGNPKPAIYPLDLKGASIPDYDDLSTKIDDNFGRLDGLVHCAASMGQLAPVKYQDPLIWLETLHINLIAAYFLTRSCLSLMHKVDKASIIFTTDHHKDKGYWAGYGISKAGVEAFSKQLADEQEGDGRVRVNCIEPGDVNTDLHTQAYPACDPVKLPTADDIVASYIYLMSDDSLGINGKLIKANKLYSG